jgi:hypothetical protein
VIDSPSLEADMGNGRIVSLGDACGGRSSVKTNKRRAMGRGLARSTFKLEVQRQATSTPTSTFPRSMIYSRISNPGKCRPQLDPSKVLHSTDI